MESKKVISRKNIPSRTPIPSTVLYALAMDYWNAPQWLWGVFGVFIVLMWIFWVSSFFTQDEIDILEYYDCENDDMVTHKDKSKFSDKIK